MLSRGSHVCVVGAGTMGGGIAAHLANLGFTVTLLDANADWARAGFERLQKAKPPHFYLPSTGEKIRVGNMIENADWIGEADWVCEAIIEKFDAKVALYDQIESRLKPGAYITTNTSGLEISRLSEGRGEAFKRTFMGTHFFNPPRYLKLLELIPTPDTDPAAVAEMTTFLEEDCARRVVLAKDTPGFIANRYGMWSMIHTIHVTEKLGMTIEEADAICGPFLGRPRSAAFRLNDLVGLDIMADIAQNLRERCPDDPYAQKLTLPRSMEFLLEKGWIGNKTGQGYYLKEGSEFLSLDLTTHAYRQRQEPDLPILAELAALPLGERIRTALADRGPVGEFLRLYLRPAMAYANEVWEEISHSVLDFDRVMMWGFGWEMGPFEMMDAIGAEALEIPAVPNYAAGTMRVSGGMQARPAEPAYRAWTDFPEVGPSTDTLSVRDLGDGVMGLGIRTKMGTVNPTLLNDLNAWLDANPDTPFVLASEAKVFSFGFDLKYFAAALDNQSWDQVEADLTLFQNICLGLSQSRGVAAVSGFCLGGGLELATGCPVVVAHAETNIGYPEAMVGLIPGGAGTVRYRLVHQGSAKDLSKSIKPLATGNVCPNAPMAQATGYLRSTDVIEFHGDRLLHTAREIAQTVMPRPWPEWQAVGGPLTGLVDQVLDELEKGDDYSRHDRKIGDALAHVFCKPNSIEEALAWERKEFIQLLKEGLTGARIRHMLESNRPLRN